MTINMSIDEDLIAAALRATGLKSKREAIELGLRTLVQMHHQARIRQVRGKLIWKGDLDDMRTDK